MAVYPGYVVLLDTETKQAKGDFAHPDANQVAFSRDGQTLASWSPRPAQNQKGCVLWDVATAKERTRLKLGAVQEIGAFNYGHLSASLAFSPDGKLVAVGTNEGVKTFDALTGASNRP